MIKIDLTARNYQIEDKVRAYVTEKIGNLDKYLTRHAKGNTSCGIILTDDPSGREDNRYVCEAVMNVDGTTLISQEATINIFAAVDIVEAKLKSQLMKYKEKHTTEPRRLRMLSRWTGRGPEVADAGTAEPAPEV
jgi:putative sigma-54 modulation protein